MKYGLLMYKETDNIGDDIQSYAASQFLPQIDYFIDRENIMTFSTEDKKPVKTIMNAWYIHDKYKFGISPYIYPLFISMHLKKFPYEDGLTIGTDYLTKETQETFKKFGPVGARDYNTKKLLDKLEIPNYFSGCLTLTIKKFPNIEKQNYICAVNISDKELEILKKKTNKKIHVINQDVEKGSLSNLSWQERKEKVIELLKLYQGAELVVTTKLHCALPCLALETNVLVLYDNYFDDRMKTFKKYFNYINRKDFDSVDITTIKNSKSYLKLRKDLTKKVEDFINNDYPEDLKYDYITYNYMQNYYNEKVDFMKNSIECLSKKNVNECKKSNLYYKKNQKLDNLITKIEQEKQTNYNNYKETIERFEKEKKIDYNNHKKAVDNLEQDKLNLQKELDDIYSSKSWKIISFFRKIKHGGK